MHIFDPERLHAIAQRHLGEPLEQMVPALTRDLAEAHPGHIEQKTSWIFNLAGGATGIMDVLHGSLSEYLLIFGTPIGTEGFSGRYHIDIHDFVLKGEFWAYTEQSCIEKKVFHTGDHALLHHGQVKGFKFPEACWLLEYGVGPVPTALPIALGDAVFSGMDGTTIAKTIWQYGRLTVRELLQGKI